jgi:hypothetical protein
VRFEREDVGFTLAERRTVPVNVLRSKKDLFGPRDLAIDVVSDISLR